MAVKYKVVSKRPGGMAGNSPVKYYPAVTKRRMIDTRGLAEEISMRTNFTTAHVLGIVETLTHVVPALLQQGNSIRLDHFGTFSLHVSGEGKDQPEQVTKKDITKVKMAFLPSKSIKEKLARTKFEKLQ